MAENTLRVVFPGFMEAIHVQLSDKTVDFSVAEVPRQYNFLEFIYVLDGKVPPRVPPKYYFAIFFILKIKDVKTFNISKVLAMKPATYGS